MVVGSNPFGGYSHQTPERDAEMVAYHTIPRIIETWNRAEAAGINTFTTNNETPHVLEAVRQYLAGEVTMQWIAQLNSNLEKDMVRAVDVAVEMGCKGLYFHGWCVEQLFLRKDTEMLKTWVEHGKSRGVPVGVAGHYPGVHEWVDSLDLVDFHMVCFFNCGSLHAGKGERFHLDDVAPAVACLQKIQKPCIAYKIMGSGRIDARMAFEYAFDNIKTGDIVNVGIHRGDKETMVEEDAALVQEILEA
jgi:hypothetical protein